MNLEQLVKTKLGIQSKQTEWKSLNLQDDLALDSLGILTVIGELEGEMGVPIELHADDDSPIQTVGDLLHRITGTSSNPMASKHIVLTGATGFIGRNLLADFLRSGARVTALVRKQGARSVRERLIAVLEPVARPRSRIVSPLSRATSPCPNVASRQACSTDWTVKSSSSGT